jgi:hypothetical protein
MARPAIRLLSVALGLLLVVALALLLLNSRGSPSGVSGSGPGQAIEETAVVPSAETPDAGERIPADGDLMRPAASESASAEGSQAVASADELRGLVVNETGEPIAGARVTISRNTARDLILLPRADTERWGAPVREVTTNASGRFAVPLPRGQPHEVIASQPDFVPTTLLYCFAGMDVRLRLTRGGRVSGRVTLEADGSPVAGARVRVLRQGGVVELFRVIEIFHGVADEQGEYRTPPLQACAVYVDVDSDLYPQRRSNVEIRAGEDVRCDVSLRRGSRVSGTVRESVRGMPIPGAEVSDSSAFERVVTTNAAGAFVLDGLALTGRDFLSARAAGYARRQTRIPRASEGDAVVVDIELEPGRRTIGRLVTESGSPLAGGLVAAVMTSEANLECLRDTSGPDGRFEIADMRPQARYLLLIQKDGFASAVYEIPSNQDQQRVTDLGDILLYEASSLEGMVVNDVDGGPVSDMLVQMWGSNEDWGRLVERAGDLETADRIRGNRRRGVSDGFLDHRARTTDRAGRFAFGNLSAGEYRIYAQAQTPTNDLRGELRVSLATGEHLEWLRIVVPLKAIVSGKVIGLDGHPVGGAHVMLSRADEIPDQPSMVIANEDGSFLFEVVHGKVYHLVVVPPIRRKLSDEQKAAIGAACLLGLVAPGKDLEIRMQPADAISGLVRDISGLPVAGVSVEALDTVVGRLNWGSTDHEGKFRLLVPPRPSVNVTVSSGARSRTLENIPSSSAQLMIELSDKP